MLRRMLLGGLATTLLVGGLGCRHLRRQGCDRDPCPPPRGGFLDDPIPTPRGSRIPPPSVPTTPPPMDTLPPPVVPDSRGSFRIDPRVPTSPWDPAPTTPLFSTSPPPSADRPPPPPANRSEKKEVILPEPLPGGVPSELPADRPSASGYLEAPVAPATPSRPTPPDAKGPTLQDPAPPRTMPEQPKALEDSTARSPVGLPGYTRVPGREGIASGQLPTPAGFDWLKANGFRTVVYLHAPGASPDAVREPVTQRGLRFLPIAVSPTTLAAALREFVAAINDRSARPLYVVDESGIRAGSLWYLVFRTQDLLGDDTARLRASPLGLTEAVTEEQKQYWLAIQDVLAKR